MISVTYKLRIGKNGFGVFGHHIFICVDKSQEFLFDYAQRSTLKLNMVKQVNTLRAIKKL
jgi:hypothetical protein